MPDVVWDDDPEADVLWDPPEVSGLESFGRGILQGGTGGFADELTAGGEALWDVATTDKTLADVPDLYGQHRGESRAAYKAAQEANPTAYGAGELGGAVATSLVPGLGPARGVAGAVKAGAVLGAASGLGSSEADLTRGDVGGALLDTAAGAGLGAAAGGAAGFLGKGLGALAAKAGRRAQAGVQKAIGEIQELAARREGAITRTARSEAGHAAQDAYRQLEHLRDLGRVGELTPAQAATFERLSQELGDSAQAKLLPAAGRKAEAAEAFARAVESEPGRIAAAEQEIGDPVRQLKPRAKRYLPPLIGSALGTVVGGPLGGAVGALAGAGTRPAVNAVRRMLDHPATRRAAWGAVLRAVRPLVEMGPAYRGAAPAIANSGLGRFARMLARALQQGGEREALALHAALLETDAEYGQGVLGLLDQEQEPAAP